MTEKYHFRARNDNYLKEESNKIGINNQKVPFLLLTRVKRAV
jgi:hypothetical protein